MPKLVRNKFTNKIDIWALGCILYELFTSEILFANDLEACHYSLDDSEIPVVDTVFTGAFRIELVAIIQDMLNRWKNNKQGSKIQGINHIRLYLFKFI